MISACGPMTPPLDVERFATIAWAIDRTGAREALALEESGEEDGGSLVEDVKTEYAGAFSSRRAWERVPSSQLRDAIGEVSVGQPAGIPRKVAHLCFAYSARLDTTVAKSVSLRFWALAALHGLENAVAATMTSARDRHVGRGIAVSLGIISRGGTSRKAAYADDEITERQLEPVACIFSIRVGSRAAPAAIQAPVTSPAPQPAAALL